jgi:muramidase (phage lysozyme)
MNANAPIGAATAAAARDKYWVYRPILDLLGKSEGTDKGRGYNETLGYGAYTGGDVDLVSMTLDQIEALQTKMLKHPKNKLKSSALGRYQIIRTTLRTMRQQLVLTGREKFDADMQDRLACFLLGQRGIDKWLAGRLSLDTLIRNLAQEWASIPKPDGKGHYEGQHAGVSVSQVKSALAEVARRHAEGQPKVIEKVPVTVETPVVPKDVDKAVKKQTNGWGWSGIGLGTIGTALTAIAGWPWQTIALFVGVGVAGGLVALVIGPWIVRRVNAIRTAVEG